MDGFGPALDGSIDVDDQLSRALLARADDQSAANRERVTTLDSPRDVDAHRERVREAVRSCVGGLPERPTDLAAETTGRRQRNGYSVELVAFESRPDFHVTANCYVPKGDGPHPAVLFLCGHTDHGKADPANQKACIELARHGFVVLAVDPVGQAEREQYRDLDLDDTVVSGGGGTFPHCYAGQKCFYAGANLARYMIHDDQCALDYLVGRNDVDADRIGVTGTSGGGTQTLYLALLDDRVDAAAPCCAVSERYEQMKAGHRTHAEQALTGSLANGLDYDALLAALAPLPVCVGAAAFDRYFPIEGVRETVDRVRGVYDLYDAADRLNLVVADAPHCSVYELGDGVFEWLCDRLGDVEFEPGGDPSTLDPSDLQCTPEGSVRDAHPTERTIDDLVRTYVEETYPNAGEQPTVDGDYAERLRARLVERFGVETPDGDLSPRVVHRAEEDGLDVERIWFKTERNPDVVVAGVLVSDPGSPPEAPAVVLYDSGTAELPDRSDEVAALAREHGAALVFDPRGVGSVRNREILVPAWADDYHGVYGTEFKLANDALLLGTSLLGMRVRDVVDAASFLSSRTDANRVSFVGDGIGAYHALYAAAIARNVDRVTVRGLGPSFFELATERAAPFHPQLTAFDVVEGCDVPHLLAALDQRGVSVDGIDDP